LFCPSGSRHAESPSPAGRGDVAHGQETIRVRGYRTELQHAPAAAGNKQQPGGPVRRHQAVGNRTDQRRKRGGHHAADQAAGPRPSVGGHEAGAWLHIGFEHA